MLKYLVRLIWPLNCPGCGEYDTHLCKKCEEKIKAPVVFQAKNGEVEIPVYAAFSYAGVIRRIMLAFKDGGRYDMLPFIRYATRKAVSSLVQEGVFDAQNLPGVGCVPAPSSFASLKRRQMLQTQHLSRAVMTQLRAEGINAAELNILRQRNIKKQVNYSGAQRAENKRDSVKVKAKAGNMAREVILIDDIITTGSTVAECVRALESAGFRVVAVIVFCATGAS
jgi:predicted amidophosphoribosyltransferase